MKNIQSHRKDEHVSLAEKFYQDVSQAGFDQIRLVPDPLPELSLEDVNIETTLAGLPLRNPFFIQAMTGGSDTTKKINAQLATVASKTNIAMAVGSQSVALKYPELAESFAIVRELNPDNLIIGNIGADTPVKMAQKAVDMIQANALQVHLNAPQEIVMPEGDRNFNWLENLAEIANFVKVPIIVKSVGFGLTNACILKIAETTNIKFFDVGGMGGTNFIKIENERRSKKDFDYLAELGITTTEALLEAQAAQNIVQDLSITATGGIRTPLDIIKSLVMGADNVGIAGYFLHKILRGSPDELITEVIQFQEHLKSIMVLFGVRNITELHSVLPVLSSELVNYKFNRKI